MEFNLTNTEKTSDDGQALIVDMTNRKRSYCSIQANTFEEKVALFNLSNAPEYRVNDFINQTIAVKDLYVESVQCLNEETGELVEAPRIILVDTDGNSYACVSRGMYTVCSKLIQIFGEPTWEMGIPLEIKQMQGRGNNKVLTARINM